MAKKKISGFVPFSTVLDVADEMLYLDDCLERAFRLAAATVLCNTEQGTPPMWLMLVGAASTGKTSAIDPFTDSPHAYKLGMITPRTLISGAKPVKDAAGQTVPSSLLNRLGSNKTLLFTDFSIILSKGREARDEIMAQLRDVYDGYAKGDWGIGTDQKVFWKGKMGALAASTEQITEYTAVMTALGERFLYLRVRGADPQKTMEKCLSVMHGAGYNESNIKDRLRAAGHAFLETKIKAMTLVDVEHEAERQLWRLSALVSTLRAAVRHDERRFDDRIMIHDPDAAARVFKQLRQLARGIACVKGSDEVKADVPGHKGGTVRDCAMVAMDSVPQDRRYALSILLTHEQGGSKAAVKAKGGGVSLGESTPMIGGLQAGDIADKSGKYTYLGISRGLRDLELLGLVLKRDPRAKIVSPNAAPEPGVSLRWETTELVRGLVGTDLGDMLNPA